MIFVILHLGPESRGELINYDHHEGTVKILHVPNDLVHFPKTPSLTYYLVKFNSGP